MKPFMTTKNPKLLDPIRKYWYLCFLYIIFSYLLIRIIVIGSSKIADATDSLFAGERLPSGVYDSIYYSHAIGRGNSFWQELFQEYL